MAFPAEHAGATQKRAWYKVRWLPSADPRLAGTVDLLSEDTYARQKQHVHVLVMVQTDSCRGGVPLGFGHWSEAQIDAWIAANTRTPAER